MDNGDNTLSFFLFLKKLRTKRGISKQQVANYLGIEQLTISEYEQGMIELPSDTIFLMCAYYSENISYESHRIARAFDLADDSLKQLVRVTLNFPAMQNNDLHRADDYYNKVALNFSKD
jgi:transcriptional regulator with XRE-family HTH domain